MKIAINFDSNEFDSPDLANSGELMNKAFIEKLQIARAIAKIPFKINSGYRTKKHNEKVGGKANSAHLKGLACDISTPTPQIKFIILKSLILAGFKRIGIYKTFIHCDIDSNLPTEIIW